MERVEHELSSLRRAEWPAHSCLALTLGLAQGKTNALSAAKPVISSFRGFFFFLVFSLHRPLRLFFVSSQVRANWRERHEEELFPHDSLPFSNHHLSLLRYFHPRASLYRTVKEGENFIHCHNRRSRFLSSTSWSSWHLSLSNSIEEGGGGGLEISHSFFSCI